MNLSNKTLKTLADLRANVESTVTSDGIVWGSVYLDNVGSSRSIAGQLSALKEAGLYKPENYVRGFGLVRMN